MARLQDLYKSTIAPQMVKEFGYENPMAVPRIVKVVISMGIGRAAQDKKFLETARKDLAAVAGQQPVVRKARKSVSNFKLRAGQDIGLMVTLRRVRMYEFMDRLISLAIPRVRDFQGLNPKSFDGRGNYSMGLSEQSAFPEIDTASIENVQGMNITFVTTANTDEEARRLLTLFGMPFQGAKETAAAVAG